MLHATLYNDVATFLRPYVAILNSPSSALKRGTPSTPKMTNNPQYLKNGAR